jgi:hypothetical protein
MMEEEDDPTPAVLLAQQICETEASRDFLDCDPVVREVLLAVDRFNVNLDYKLMALAAAWETLQSSLELEAQLAEKGEYQLSGASLVRIRDKDSSGCFYGEAR